MNTDWNNVNEIKSALLKLDDINGCEDFDIEELELTLQSQLKCELEQVQFLESEKAKIGNPESLTSVILNQVWREFGNQIGLDITAETLVERYEKAHPEKYDEVGKNVMKDHGYRDAKDLFQREWKTGELVDAYTGKKLSDVEKLNVDHVVSRKELFESYRRKQADLNVEELANNPENLQPTNEALNKSKRESSVDEWLGKREIREKDLIAQNERATQKIMNSDLSEEDKRLKIDENNRRLQNKLDADEQRMRVCDREARYAINKDIAVNATMEIGKKACEDAVKMMVVTALFKLAQKVMKGLVRYFKSKAKTFKKFLNEMRTSIKEFFLEIKDVLWKGAGTFIGSIVTEIMGPIINSFKRISSMFKQAGASLMEAIRYLSDEENKNKPFRIKIAQVGKIIVAGIFGGVAVVLSDAFEKLLWDFPGMQVVIPTLGTLANVIGMFFASLLSGLLGTVVIYRIDKYIEEQQIKELTEQQIDKNNDVLNLQEMIKHTNEAILIQKKETVITGINQRHEEAQKEIYKSLSEIFDDKEEVSSDVDFTVMNKKLSKLKLSLSEE